jgi:hypothetical protein
MGNLKKLYGQRQIVLVSTAGFSVLNTGIFWWEAKTKRLFSQCMTSSYMILLHLLPQVQYYCTVYKGPVLNNIFSSSFSFKNLQPAS